jgi:cytochrome c
MKCFVTIALSIGLLTSPVLAEDGNSMRGQRDFRACAPCHSLQPNHNMTGPSLANL